MKKIIPVAILLACITSVFFSCKKSELLRFSAESAIYFNQNAGDSLAVYYHLNDSLMGVYWTRTVTDTGRRVDTIVANTGTIVSEDDELIIAVDVRVMGTPSSSDRKFDLLIDPSSTFPASAISLNPADCFVKAGELRALVPLRVKRISELLQKPLYVTVTLAGVGDGLDTAYNVKKVDTSWKPLVKRTYGIYDNLPAPIWWKSSYGVVRMGPYSVTKFRYLANFLGLTTTYLSASSITPSLINGIGRQFYCHLKSMKEAGTPVMDKDDLTGKTFEMEAGATSVNSCWTPVE
ncbi:DUF4843 domain-containing protein [Chitinophaga sp. sic0106]|uniref:DUF4843 domain-containing protein n=1 Tax=Chitinophaga sp. sic0106 TaxID=2854785 RepID=UPI001C48F691|nr:DUF4843 domain-containing protein [Chitinophaga sp. sic0106]MBV7532553.1 DUF4843 domain-containing protein [Chitinophaga sp. sic0106]